MKKNTIKLDKALSLDKETIAKLNEEQLNGLEGGLAAGGTNTCNTGPVKADDGGTTIGSCLACSCN